MNKIVDFMIMTLWLPFLIIGALAYFVYSGLGTGYMAMKIFLDAWND